MAYPSASEADLALASLLAFWTGRKLMRHESIETTMAYYVDLDADELAEDLYRDQRWAENGQEGTVSGTVANSDPDTAVTAGDSNTGTEKGCEVGPAGFEPATKGL